METSDSFVDPIKKAAAERFGLDYLFPYQRLVIANVLDTILERPSGAEDSHEDFAEESLGVARENDLKPLRQVVILPTGSGKSLCFQLPVLFLPRPTIVIFPLLALMRDQKRRMEERGLPCAVFRGGMEKEEFDSNVKALHSGRANIVLTNPESLGSRKLMDVLQKLHPSHLVIDEAHCVAEWGDSFRPSYLELGRIAGELNPDAFTAFTATASPEVLARVREVLFSGNNTLLISGNPDRPNISYSVVPTLSRKRTLMRLVHECAKPLIIFTSSRPGSQILAEDIMERFGRDFPLRFYHAGLSREEKNSVESWFFNSKDGVLVSTCAYGMGVDKPDIRTVIHATAPPSVEAYLQESGRAGRDGEKASAILVRAPDEGSGQHDKTPGISGLRAKALLHYADTLGRCRREILMELMGAPFEACFACDVCESTAMSHAEGEREALDFTARNQRRYSIEEAAGFASATCSGRRCPAYGVLSGWKQEEARESFMALIARKSLTVGSGPFWKGRLMTARKKPHCLESESSGSDSSVSPP